MTIRSYGEAISTLAIAYGQIPETEQTATAHYMIRMAINALTDCINHSLGFREPERVKCDCGKDPGPACGEEEGFYRAHPISDDDPLRPCC